MGSGFPYCARIANRDYHDREQRVTPLKYVSECEQLNFANISCYPKNVLMLLRLSTMKVKASSSFVLRVTLETDFFTSKVRQKTQCTFFINV